MVGRNKIIPYKAQKYDALRTKHQALGTLFTDPIFPPTTLSVYRNKPPPGNITWKRPQELSDNPTMFLENEQLSIFQGKLGKPWFLTACYALANAQELWNRVIPNYRDQIWDQNASAVSTEGATLETAKKKYAGIFHFQFWRFGKWVDVVIDDLLPVLSVNPTAPPSPSSSPVSSGNTDSGLPLFTRSSRPNEMWVSLIEKAYAKLLGSYEALEYGTLKDAVVDFTGGVSEELSWTGEKSEESKHEVFRTLHNEMQEHSLVCCMVEKSEDEENEGTRTEVGLVHGRMYIMTSVKKVYLADTKLHSLLKGKEKIGMVRLKDPLERNAGSQLITEPDKEEENAEGEASGSVEEEEADSGVYVYPPSKLRRLFSKSPEWARVTNSQLTRMGLLCQTSNEFWMPWDDLFFHLSTLTVCRLFNTNVFALGRTWKERMVLGSWKRGAKGTSADRSGGGTPRVYPETFLRNPQYLFDVTIDEEEVVIQLLQWPIDTQEAETQDAPLATAINIFQVEENRKYRMHSLLDCCPIMVECGPSNSRELYHRGHIARGRYLLVPSTAIPGDSANFFLRIYSSNVDIKLRELKHDYPVKWQCSPLSCCVPSPVFVSSITIRHAEGLNKLKASGSFDPYCVICCENSKAKTPVIRNTREPVWDTSFVFYRYKMEKPIVIRVYNHNAFMPDNLLGEALFPAPVNHQRTEICADVINPKGKKNEQNITSGRSDSVDSSLPKGSITVEILTEDDVMAI